MRSWSRDRPTSTSSCARITCPRPARPCWAASSRSFPAARARTRPSRAHAPAACATRMLLALGEDAFAPLMEQSLRDAGVTLHIVRVAQAASGVALICLADDAENAITVAPGANAMLRGCGPAAARRRRLSAAAARNAARNRHGIRAGGARQRRQGAAERRAGVRAAGESARGCRRADRQRGRAREGRGTSRCSGRSARIARCAVRCRHARRARLLRDGAWHVLSAACLQGRAGRYDRGRRHFLRRARSRAVLGVPPAAGTAPRERRRSPRDDARRGAVEHPRRAGGRSAAALACGRTRRRSRRARSVLRRAIIPRHDATDDQLQVLARADRPVPAAAGLAARLAVRRASVTG